MTAARWRLIANGCLLLAVCALLSAFVGYGLCVVNVADGMTRELNPLTETELGSLIDRATADVEDVPTGFGARAGLAHPVCYAEHPAGDQVLSWGLLFFGFVGFFFARNQAQFERQGGVQTPKRERRQTGVTQKRRDGPLPDEIDVGDVNLGLSDRDKEILDAVSELNTRDESLMLYLNRQKGDDVEEDVPRDIDGFFCPRGYHDKPILYVDPEHIDASDEMSGADPSNNPERPFKSIEGALNLARALLEEGSDGVMVRVIPGVYHASINIPDRCVLVNHRLPAEGTARGRLKWLTDQSADHPDCVTLLTPPDAVYAVNFDEGARQGIFGCHIVGRENVRQAGIVAVSCRAMAIVNCSIESFTGGGIRLQDTGTELAGGGVMIHGCRMSKNVSKRGGAIYAERSSIAIVDCIIERNRAFTGGAVYGVDLRAPLSIATSRVAHNRAQLDETPAVSIDDRPIEDWQRESGLGGGVYLLRSRLKIVGAEFVENGASVGGAGVALLGGKGIIESEESNVTRFARNKARVGAGVMLVGWAGHDATLKISDALFKQNRATVGGGGLAVIGVAIAQLVDTELAENEITEARGFGGGAVAWNGGELLGAGVSFLENKSAGSGGAIAVINARMNFKLDSRIRANVANISGGGIYAVTTPSNVALSLLKSKVVKAPFAVTLENVKISNNASTDLGGGLRGGNEVGTKTPPLGFKLGENVRFQLNRTRSQKENGDDVWVVWCGEVKATDRNLPEKLVLR